jgi:hypothetical protein
MRKSIATPVTGDSKLARLDCKEIIADKLLAKNSVKIKNSGIKKKDFNIIGERNSY